MKKPYFLARFFDLVDLVDLLDFFVVEARLDALRLDALTAAINASHLALTDGDIGMD